MTDDLLAGGQPAEPKSYLAELTKEGGKFDKSKYASDADLIEALAKGKWHADSALSIKEKAFDDMSADYLRMKEEVDKGPKIQDIIDQMNKFSNNNNQVIPETPGQVPGFDPKQIPSLVAQEYAANKLADAQAANRREVQAKLVERYGNNYQAHVKQQITELGVSEDLFNSLAANNPRMLIRTLGLDQEQITDTFQAPPRNAMRTDQFAPRGGEKRTWSYYQNMKKTNPAQYSNPKTQAQMHMDYMNLGREFEDGDYHMR
jgi:hypothetical protein